MIDLKKSIRPRGPGKSKVRSELNAFAAGARQTSLAAWVPTHVNCIYQVRLLYQVYLSITDDGKGIQALEKALTLASSTKIEPTDHEIGQFGKGLKYAPWHIGDDDHVRPWCAKSLQGCCNASYVMVPAACGMPAKDYSGQDIDIRLLPCAPLQCCIVKVAICVLLTLLACLWLSRSSNPDGVLYLGVLLYSYSYQKELLEDDPAAENVRQVICKWKWDEEANPPSWQVRFKLQAGQIFCSLAQDKLKHNCITQNYYLIAIHSESR